jgi:HD-GYP domain-containing protein (c-di-GMP phosphodiesterase class II)
MNSLLGEKVSNVVVNRFGLAIIPANTVIGRKHLDLINRHKIDRNSIALEKNDEGTRLRQLTEQTVDHSIELFQSIAQTSKIPVMEFKNTVIPAVQQIANSPDIFRLFEAVKARDDYTHRHNIGVGVLATLIAKWMNMEAVELSSLSLAATLHDVGKVKIPLEILHKPGTLTSEEFYLIKQHTVLGYEMLKNTVGVSHRIALAALQHHEKEDGSGYPLGLKKDQIDLFGKIIAVADIFHAMSSERPYHKSIPFYDIVSQMRDHKFGKLDPHIVSIFIENITKNLIGKNVMLTDDRQGEVVYLNPQNDMNPLVRIENEFISLSVESQLHIKEVLADDV